MSEDLCFLSAVQLRQLYQSGQASPVEVTKALLARIERVNPGLNALVTISADLALEQARQAEADYAAGTAGILAGVPVSIKDLTPTAGITTARGSLLYRDWVPDFDAPIVERLKAAGAVVLGKTNTPELGWKGDSGNRVFGPTHNPWRHGHTAGGSSGGSAAAVAAGLGPLAQGSDGAGSIRIPSAFCGLYGFKPSWGSVPHYPASAVELFAHLGPISRTVEDGALMLQVMAGAEARDPLSFDLGIDYRAALEGDLTGLRVAWSPDLGYAAIDPEVRHLVAAAASRFEELGCRVEEAHPGLADPWDEIADVVWASAFAGLYLEDLARLRDQLDPGLVAVIEHGAQFSGADMARALRLRNEYYHEWRGFMAQYDLLLTPTLPVTAFAAGADQPGQVAGRDTAYLSWTAFTYPFNITGQPAATVPCGMAENGLPVGLQIVGRWRQDGTVLRASAGFERVAPWADRWPSLD